jgi:hypothetical protein
MVRLNSIYHYFFGLPENEIQIIEKQKRLRSLLHRQINLSKIKLKPTNTIIKYGIYELDRDLLIKECIDINKLKFVDEYEKSKINFINKNNKKKRRKSNN